jgi:small subunit ribosomal protein S6
MADTLRPYEMVVILHPDLEIDLDKPLKKISDIVTKNGGKIAKSDNWGKRKLAYPIKKEEFGVYVYYEIELPGDKYSKVENALNISDEVLRYLITHPVPKVEKPEEEAEKPEEKDEKEVKSSEADEKSANNEEEDKNDE